MVDLINKKFEKSSRQILFEQYKIIVDSADRLTDRRQNANRFYLTINTLLFGSAAYLTFMPKVFVAFLFSFLGLLVSFVWIANIKSFKRLNNAKFKVIHKLEEYLPARVYQKEDQYLQRGYYKLTSVERWVPIIFGVLHLIVITFILYLNW